MEPIPLRTLTVLLNYERMISDPRFEGVRLLISTAANLTFSLNRSLPPLDSVDKQTIHEFEPYTEPASTVSPPTICAIHPDALPEMHRLTFNQREIIYHETRGQSDCYKAVGLFQFFFDLCPPGQKLLVRLKKEDPVLIDIGSYSAVKFVLKEPKSSILTTIPSNASVLCNGIGINEIHCVMVFECGRLGSVVVDMTRMQYGVAGRGLFGENYFIGSKTDYESTMKVGICGELVHIPFNPIDFDTRCPTETRLRMCAQRVWERWQNRAKEGWCDFCGKGGKDLGRCSACWAQQVKVNYCCIEHQKAGWKLHKLTCKAKEG